MGRARSAVGALERAEEWTGDLHAGGRRDVSRLQHHALVVRDRLQSRELCDSALGSRPEARHDCVGHRQLRGTVPTGSVKRLGDDDRQRLCFEELAQALAVELLDHQASLP
jgi:hypothetical protein